MKRKSAKVNRVRLDPSHASMEAIYTQLQRALGFPDHFGRNLDALWDVMHDVPGPIEIVWQGHEEARRQLGDGFDKLVELFRDLERERSDFRLVLEAPSGRP
jgi:ribonuclease inhibitor